MLSWYYVKKSFFNDAICTDPWINIGNPWEGCKRGDTFYDEMIGTCTFESTTYIYYEYLSGPYIDQATCVSAN